MEGEDQESMQGFSFPGAVPITSSASVTHGSTAVLPARNIHYSNVSTSDPTMQFNYYMTSTPHTSYEPTLHANMVPAPSQDNAHNSDLFVTSGICYSANGSISDTPNSVMQDGKYCIVCATVQDNLVQHMQTHSKEEMIFALMGKHTPGLQAVKEQPLTPAPMGEIRSTCNTPSVFIPAGLTPRPMSSNSIHPLKQMLPMTSQPSLVTLVPSGSSNTVMPQPPGTFLGLQTPASQAVHVVPVVQQKTYSKTIILNSSARPMQRFSAHIPRAQLTVIPRQPPPSYQHSISNNSSNGSLNNTVNPIAYAGAVTTSGLPLVNAGIAQIAGRIVNSNGNKFTIPIKGRSKLNLQTQSQNTSSLVHPVDNSSQMNQSFFSQTQFSHLGTQATNNSCSSNISGVNNLTVGQQVPLLLMPNCTMQVMQQAQHVHVNTVGTSTVKQSTNMQQQSGQQPLLKQQNVQIPFLSSPQQLHMCQEQHQQSQIYNQQQQLQQIQQPNVTIVSQQNVTPKIFVLGNSTSGNRILTQLPASNLQLNMNNASVILTNNRVQQTVHPTLINANRIVGQNISGTNTINTPTSGGQTNKPLLLPQLPSYQTAIKNSMLVNAQEFNCRNNAQPSNSVNNNVVEVAGNTGGNVQYQQLQPSSKMKTARKGCCKDAVQTSNSASSTSKLENDCGDYITVQVGSNISISVPKDMKDKRERLQQIINEELVRGIIWNDKKDITVKSDKKGHRSNSCNEGSSNLLANDEMCLDRKDNLKSYNSQESLKIELFDEPIESSGNDCLYNNEHVGNNVNTTPVGKDSSETIPALYNTLFIQDKYSENPKDVVPFTSEPFAEQCKDNSVLKSSHTAESIDLTIAEDDASGIASEKIFVSEILDIAQSGPSRVSQWDSLQPSNELDPLALQSIDNRDKQISKVLSKNMKANVLESRASAVKACKSRPLKRSIKSYSNASSKTMFVTSFTDLIKKDNSTDEDDSLNRKSSRAESPFLSGSSSFKVVGMEEQELHCNQIYMPLEVKVKEDEICIGAEEPLFSPSSVVSSGSSTLSHTDQDNNNSADNSGTNDTKGHSIHPANVLPLKSCSLRSSINGQHDEDMSLRAAETLADSDSEHGPADSRSVMSSGVDADDCSEHYNNNTGQCSSTSGFADPSNMLHLQMDAHESLATSEVLMANLSEESNVSVQPASPQDSNLAPHTTSSMWIPVRHYSPKHHSRLINSPTSCDNTTLSRNSPIDLRQSPSRQSSLLKHQKPHYSDCPPQYQTSSIDLQVCGTEAYASTVADIASSSPSLQQHSGLFPSPFKCEAINENSNLATAITGPEHLMHTPPHSGSLVNPDGVVLNLDSCTVLPQTLNFAHLFSPNSTLTNNDTQQYLGNVAGCSSEETNQNTNGIYLATSALMRNISSYLSPNKDSRNSSQDNLSAADYSNTSAILGGIDSPFHEFNTSCEEPILSPTFLRKSPSKHGSPKKGIFSSPRLLGSPQPSTSGLVRSFPPSLHEQDYEFDYDSDCYADSDCEAHIHGRSSLPLEQWKCQVCNKMFKSLKEKLLHSGKHSPRCVGAAGSLREMRIRSVKTGRATNNDTVNKELAATNNSTIVEDCKIFIAVKGENVKQDPDSVDDVEIAATIKEEESKELKEAKAKEALKTVEACRTDSHEYKCPECSAMFASPEELLSHRRKVLSSRLICPICHEEFEKSSYKRQHLKESHTDNFSCSFCHVSYKSLYNWSRHQLQHLGIALFECNICGRRFTRNFEYMQHKRVHTGERPHNCPECDKTFASENNLRRHLHTHLENHEVNCDICSKEFKNSYLLSKHKYKIHPKDGQKKRKIHRDFICSQEGCVLLFPSAKKLAWHQETHQRWPKRCEYCQERFIHSSNLVKHIRQKHNAKYMEEQAGNEACPLCSKVLLKSSLVQHMRIHSGERPFKCHMCSKTFRVKCNLEAHMFVHSGKRDRPFKCTICQNSFGRQKDLEAHIRSHKNIRPFTCNECGKAFLYKNNLAMHMKQHFGEKEHKCSHCDKAFYRRYNLINHERVHTGQAPYTCPICLKPFSQKSNYNVHRKSFHVDRHTVHEEL
uniref:Zinc finger protein 624 n=1 Tax=Hirondellea gigas TaxID=1518452 RepID=A0A6A7FR42_9CRUS